MSDAPKPEEKKIIVDEDWKSRVEEEREEQRQKEQEATAATPEGDATAAGETQSAGAASGPTGAASDEATGEAGAEQAVPLPPPTLGLLLGSLYLQGMMALGLLPNPVTEKAEVHLDQARHTIDMLAMLQQKTEGNRTQEESDELERILHELRMAFVAVQQRQAGQ